MYGKLLSSAILIPLLHYAVSIPCCNKSDDHVIMNGNKVICKEDDIDISIAASCPEESYWITYEEEEDIVLQENEDKTAFTYEGTYCIGDFLNYDEIRKTIFICNSDPEPLEVVDYVAIYGVLISISVLFLLSTLTVYILLPPLRDLQGKCIMSFIFSLMLGYTGLASLQLPFFTPHPESSRCIFTAFFTYFGMLGAFVWMSITSFNILRSMALTHINISEKKVFMCYCIVGWTIPFIFLTVTLVMHHKNPFDKMKPGFGEVSCWFNGKIETWVYFFGPVAFLISLNFIFFSCTMLFLWREYKNPTPVPRIRNLRLQFLLSFKLFLIMGISWIFEILSAIEEEPWYVTDGINCLQGLIIFLVLVIFRKRVWRALTARKICSSSLAICWQNLEDEEIDTEPVVEAQAIANL